MQILQSRDELEYQKVINLHCKFIQEINKLMTATCDCYQKNQSDNYSFNPCHIILVLQHYSIQLL